MKEARIAYVYILSILALYYWNYWHCFVQFISTIEVVESLAMMLLSCQMHLAFILPVVVFTMSSSFVHKEKKYAVQFM